jgi:hypothetical protein
MFAHQSGVGLFQDNILAFAWRDCGEQRGTSVMTSEDWTGSSRLRTLNASVSSCHTRRRSACPPLHVASSDCQPCRAHRLSVAAWRVLLLKLLKQFVTKPLDASVISASGNEKRMVQQLIYNIVHVMYFGCIHQSGLNVIP